MVSTTVGDDVGIPCAVGIFLLFFPQRSDGSFQDFNSMHVVCVPILCKNFVSCYIVSLPTLFLLVDFSYLAQAPLHGAYIDLLDENGYKGQPNRLFFSVYIAIL